MNKKLLKQLQEQVGSPEDEVTEIQLIFVGMDGSREVMSTQKIKASKEWTKLLPKKIEIK